MTAKDAQSLIRRAALAQYGALACLLLLGGMAIVGPSGMLALGESLSVLEERKAQIKELEEERVDLQNRVAGLDPNGADPDVVTELLRSHMNVVHPDEVVLVISDSN